MSEITGGDKIRNHYKSDNVGVVSILNKVRDNRLRWIGFFKERKDRDSKISTRNACCRKQGKRKTQKDMRGCIRE